VYVYIGFLFVPANEFFKHGAWRPIPALYKCPRNHTDTSRKIIMRRTTLGFILLFSSCACLGGNDVWETLFKEKLKEANAGNSNAQYDIGAMFQNGRGVATSRGSAIEWYRKAAAQNNQKAISRLNLIQSNELRFNKTLALAGGGDMESQYDLGNMYMEGVGVDTDKAKAIGWYGKAAAQGYEKAQYKLGLIYYEESAPENDLSLAFSFFKEAAEKGYPAAQFYLGKMYASGQGVKRNYATALQWYSKAVDGGFNDARREMTDVAELLKDKPVAKEPRTVKTARPAQPATPAQVERDPGYTYEDLVLASWNRDKDPVAYLPSAINNCSIENNKVVCFSNEQASNTAAGTIKYKTKSIVSELSQEGFFEVVYRNLVIDADQAAASKTGASEEVIGSTSAGPAKINYEVQTGWGKEHTLQCEFKNSRTLSCLKDNTHAFLLESTQTLAAGD
jgi:TPR repeat protein